MEVALDSKLFAKHIQDPWVSSCYLKLLNNSSEWHSETSWNSLYSCLFVRIGIRTPSHTYSSRDTTSVWCVHVQHHCWMCGDIIIMWTGLINESFPAKCHTLGSRATTTCQRPTLPTYKPERVTQAPQWHGSHFFRCDQRTLESVHSDGGNVGLIVWVSAILWGERVLGAKWMCTRSRSKTEVLSSKMPRLQE